jgi:hypothetical protein
VTFNHKYGELKRRKKFTWSGKMRFSNHLPEMNIICRR